MRQQKHQAGFGTIGIILAATVVVVVAASGLVVYHYHNKGNNATNSSTTTSTSQSKSQLQNTTTTQQPAQTTAATLDITQWGVHLTLDSTTASMYYYISASQPDIAYFSLKDIDAIAPNCAADKVSLGAISRLTEAQQQTATANPSALNQPGTIHIGNYWYIVGISHTACISTSSEQASISQGVPGYNPGEILKTLNTLAAD
jgi:hypothetical protein